MRAATDPHVGDDSQSYVDIVSKAHWYRWMFTDEPPKAVPYRLYSVWTEG